MQPRRAVGGPDVRLDPVESEQPAVRQNQLTGAYTETADVQDHQQDAQDGDLRPQQRAELQAVRRGRQDLPESVTIARADTKTVSVTIRLSRSDVARLPGASANDGGELISIHGWSAAGRGPIRRRAAAADHVLVRPGAAVRISKPRPASPKPRWGLPADPALRNTGVHTGDGGRLRVAAGRSGRRRGRSRDRRPDQPRRAIVPGAGRSGAGPPTGCWCSRPRRRSARRPTRPTRWTWSSTATVTGPDFITFAADTGLVAAEPQRRARRHSPSTLRPATWSAPGRRPRRPTDRRCCYRCWPAVSRATEATGPLLIAAAGLTVFDNTPPVDEMDGPHCLRAVRPGPEPGRSGPAAPGRCATIPAQVDEAQLAEQTAAGWLVVRPRRPGRTEGGRPGAADSAGGARPGRRSR